MFQMTRLVIWSALVWIGISADTEADKTAAQSASHPNSVPYERTFMKYHHKRKINHLVSPDYEDFLKLNDFDRFKRNLDDITSNDETNLESHSNSTVEISQPTTPSEYNNIHTANDSSNKSEINRSDGNHLSDANVSSTAKGTNVAKSVDNTGNKRVKAAIVLTSTTTTEGPRHICLHKYHRVAQSEKISAVVGTHSPAEEKDYELIASDKVEEPGRPYNATLPDGSVALVEECAHSCYALWLPGEDGAFTVLGQGCWQTSSPGCAGAGAGCDAPHCAGGPASLPGAYFCCCRGDLCNARVRASPADASAAAAGSAAATPARRDAAPAHVSWATVSAFVALAAAAALLLAALLRTVRARRARAGDLHASDVEKADGTGGGAEAMATGLLCVDNLTLIEHIGAGKFGSVWRGSLGGAPVAVKLCSGAASWRREAQLYSTLRHPHLLKYYGSDARPTLTEGGGRQHLLVLELCCGTLRRRLRAAPLAWQQFAALAHGLASAVAYLHSPLAADGVHKPCVVHRDINSNNVLVTSDGQARLADLGLSVAVQPAGSQPRPHRITEAGTLRYLAPEALDGALDLAGARAALCAVDVFALGLVLWEMLWRTCGAHAPAAAAPPYAAPYEHAGLVREPTLTQMQALVSRGKVRPPLPRGPATEARALRLAADTCEECWDHDAEARLTAVCVEERLSELRQLLQPAAPLVRGDNLHPHAADSGAPAVPESDKNSNCTSAQACDITTPLLYSRPHIGRNPCLERNTNTGAGAQSDAQLVHKSLKDIAHAPAEGPRVQNVDDNCLSVARLPSHRGHAERENSERLNEIRSFQRPLEYVPNDVSCRDDRQPKQTNLLNDVKIERAKWGLGRFFGKKSARNARPIETEVKLMPESSHGNSVVQSANGKFRTSVVVHEAKKTNCLYANGRPSNLTISDGDARGSAYNFEGPCTLSPPNRTLSPTMMMESRINNTDKVFAFKELPHVKNCDDGSGPKPPNHIFAVIVPKAKSNLIEMHSKSRGSSESIHKKSVNVSISSQSLQAGLSESEDSTVKKNRLSCDDKIITSSHLLGNSGNSSRASIEMELRYISGERENNYGNDNDSRSYDINTDCSSSSEDENLMLLSENGGSKITMQPIPKAVDDSKRKYQNDVLKEASQTKDFGSFCNKFPKKGYTNFDNEYSDPNDKENLDYSGDNPVYIAAIKGEIDTGTVRFNSENGHCSPKRKARECRSESDDPPKSPKPSLKYLSIKRQHSLEQVGEIFSSSGDLSHLQNPAGRVKTPGDLPVAVRRARRDRALQKGRVQETNRLSLYDDRMMFGNSL